MIECYVNKINGVIECDRKPTGYILLPNQELVACCELHRGMLVKCAAEATGEPVSVVSEGEPQ